MIESTNEIESSTQGVKDDIKRNKCKKVPEKTQESELKIESQNKMD